MYTTFDPIFSLRFPRVESVANGNCIKDKRAVFLCRETLFNLCIS